MSFEWRPFTHLLSTIVDNRGRTCPVGTEGLPLIATNCVVPTNLYPSYETTRFVSKETYKNWFRSHPLPGDILFVCKGSPGRTNLVPDPVDFCIAQDMVAVRADPKKIDPTYLFAALRSSMVQSQIDNLHVGTMIPHFKKGDFGKLNIPVPSRGVQIQIGHYYLVVSQRITLLRETNSTLGAIAQALFKSWFIDFDPVRAKMEGRVPEGMDEATAALFPDQFEESKLGPVPKGWQVAMLYDTSAYLSRGLSPKYVESGGVLVLNQKCIRDFVVDYKKGRRHDPVLRKIEGRYLEVGDVLVNSTGVGTLGRVAQVLELPEPAVVDSHVTVLRAGEKLRWTYLGEWAKQKQPDIEAMGEGSTGQTELSRSKLGQLPILVPSAPVLQAFDDATKSLKARVAVNERSAQTLAVLRDALLPRLISGQLRLPENTDASAEEVFANSL